MFEDNSHHEEEIRAELLVLKARVDKLERIVINAKGFIGGLFFTISSIFTFISLAIHWIKKSV